MNRKLIEIQKEVTAQSLTRKWLRVVARPLPSFLLVGVAVFMLLWGGGSLGAWERLELALYDHGLSWVRHTLPSSSWNPPVVLVGATEDDVNNTTGWPLSDRQLAQVLQRLLAMKPRVIGVDLLRDQPRLEGWEALKELLLSHDNVIMARSIPYGGNKGIPAPPYLEEEGSRTGMVNVPVDADGRSRRGVLFLLHQDGRPVDSLAFLLALRYLEELGFVPGPSPKGHSFMRLGAADLRRFQAEDGGYHRANAQGFQFLLDFSEASHPLPFYAMGDLLAGRVPPEAVRNRVVLVGMTAPSIKDHVDAPLRLTPLHPLFGLEWHALATSQIIRMAMTGQGGMHVLPEAAATVWLLLWCLVGGVGAWLPHFSRVAVLSCVLLLSGVALGGLALGLWLPWGGPATGLLLTHGIARAMARFKERGQHRKLLQLWWNAEQERAQAVSRSEELSDAHARLQQEQELVNQSSRATLLIDQEKLDEAWDVLRPLPMTDPLLPICLYLGNTFEQMGKVREARAVYLHIFRFAPSYEDVSSRLIERFSDQDDPVARLRDSVVKNTGRPKLLPRLDRYILESVIGSGAMGVVFLARDPRIGRHLAIKVQSFLADGGRREEDSNRFFREMQSMGRLSHEHIVHIYDAGHDPDGGFVWLAMEFVEGNDLTSFTRKNNLLPMPLAVYVISRIAMALDHCERQQVVHRDVKPANIMVSKDFRMVKLSDFGVVRLLDGVASELTRQREIGTLSYMSPEQLQGIQIDHRSDLFSLGATLFHLLTGSLPFSGENDMNTMYKIINGFPPDPRSLRPNLPPCLADVLQRALVREVDGRYQHGKEMARDLSDCLKRMK